MITAGIMPFLMAGFITWLSLGLDNGFPALWLRDVLAAREAG